MQAHSADLDNLAALSGPGLVAKTVIGAALARTITGTANQISVADGDGAGGNPTLSTPQDIHTGATPTFAGMTTTGGVKRAVKSINFGDSPYTILATDHKILVDTSIGAVVVNLPTAVSSGNRELSFKVSSGANGLTIQRAGLDLIDGATSLALASLYDFARLQSDGGTAWHVGV